MCIECHVACENIIYNETITIVWILLELDVS
jgi:hypothetical protein